MQNHKEDSIVNGGFFVRLAAFTVDSIITGGILLFIKFIVFIASLFTEDFPLTKSILFQYSFIDIALYLLQVGYFILLTYYTGTTLGKRLFHLRVVSTDGEKLTLWNVVFRETIGRYLSSVVLYVGYIMIGVDRDKRGLHDMLSDTKVIYSCKVKVYPVYPNYYSAQQPIMQNPQPPYQTSVSNNENTSNQEECEVKESEKMEE